MELLKVIHWSSERREKTSLGPQSRLDKEWSLWASTYYERGLQHSGAVAPSPGFTLEHMGIPVHRINLSRNSLMKYCFLNVFLHLPLLPPPSFSPYVEPIIKSPFDDIDPEYGLHGYQLHFVLYNSACTIMSRSFPQIFCRRSTFILIFTKIHCAVLNGPFHNDL